jgi:hypothetical protein
MTHPTARPALLALASLVPVALGFWAAARAGDPAGERTAAITEDGVVHVVTAPTPVRYERTWRGHDYVRTLDGSLEGRLLVMETEFLK